MKGRKPKPYLLAKLDGKTGHYRKPICPEASVGDYDPPIELDAVARAEWDRVKREAGWILAVNAALLAERCSAFADLQRVKKAIKRGDKPTEGRPLTAIRNELRAYILRADAELGLTPCSQSKVAAPPKSERNPIEAAMFGA